MIEENLKDEIITSLKKQLELSEDIQKDYKNIVILQEEIIKNLEKRLKIISFTIIGIVFILLLTTLIFKL
jgi:hypothetical protein